MTKLLLPLASFLLALWLFGGSWWFVKTYYSYHENAFVTSNVPPLIVKDGSEIAYAPETFGFRHSSERLIISEAASDAFQSIANYLIYNPSKQIELMGLYAPSEENYSEYTNLGIARADVIRGELIKLGVASSRIQIIGTATNNTQFIESICYNCLDISFEGDGSRVDDGRNYNNTSKQIIKVRSLNVYFKNKASISHLSTDMDDYFEDLKQYLNTFSESKVSITGHTDNVGSRKGNFALSKKRARKFRDFMVKNGFKENRLLIEFKGPDEPISSNSTPEGRRKNRRVEIRLK